MKRHLLVALAAVLVVGISASSARAQCSFEHPKKATKLQSTLVQAFVSCGNPGGNTQSKNCSGGANDNAICTTNSECPGGTCVLTTAGGVPACKPPETFCTQSGKCPGTGWEWNELKGAGKVQFKPRPLCTQVSVGGSLSPCSQIDPLNTNNGAGPNSADLEVRLQLKGVLQSGNQQPASGTGKLATVARATLNDNMNGDETVIDFPAGFPFDLISGSANLKTSADALLNSNSLPGLPPCTSIEVVGVRVLDVNGDAFATMGTFLPLP